MTVLAYLAVGVAAFARSPSDGRARAFLATAILNAGPGLSPLLFWYEGDRAAFTPTIVLVLAVTGLLGGLTLFHFTQLFPRTRPWIARHRAWLVAAYVVVPVACAALVMTAPPAVEEITTAYLAVALLVGLPLLLFFGVFVPLCGLTSLLKSYREASAEGRTGDARVVLWMLVSQLAGGVLALIVVPLLHMLRVPPIVGTFAAALLFVFSLGMPAAYARSAR